MEPASASSPWASTILDAAVRFYRDGVGLRDRGDHRHKFEHGAVAFFDLQGGLKLALWPRA